MLRLVNKLPSYSLHKPPGQARVRFNGKTTCLGKHRTPESHQRYAEFIAKLPASSQNCRIGPFSS
jgi:hypothetical protein